MQQAREVIESQAKGLAAARQPDYEAKAARRQAQRGAGKKPRGPESTPPSTTPGPKAQYNFTDPQSGIMKAGSGAHFEQSYNAQAAVDGAMLIVGARVSMAANDKQELPATVAAISPVVAPEIRALLADSGFYSEAAVQAIEQKADGTAPGLTVYAAVEKTGHHKTVADLLPQPQPAIGRELYKLRKQTVEPVFGIIKEVMGLALRRPCRVRSACGRQALARHAFRRFSLRGHAKVSPEWTLVCVSYNLKRLFTLKTLASAA